MLRRLACLAALFVIASSAVAAAQYKVVIRRLEPNLFQAQASKVIIETRRCDALAWDADQEDAVLNWEGSFGHNWILFTASGTRCDVSAIR